MADEKRIKVFSVHNVILLIINQYEIIHQIEVKYPGSVPQTILNKLQEAVANEPEVYLDFVVEPEPTPLPTMTRHTRRKRNGDTKEEPACMSKKKKGSRLSSVMIMIIMYNYFNLQLQLDMSKMGTQTLRPLRAMMYAHIAG